MPLLASSSIFDIAQRFDKKAFFEPLAAHRDELQGLHANTHIPQVIAAARLLRTHRRPPLSRHCGILLGRSCVRTQLLYRQDRNHEHWKTVPGKLAAELSSETAEDCCAYNMMKLTRHLFGWSPDARLMDYYERVMFNHRLGTINTATAR